MLELDFLNILIRWSVLTLFFLLLCYTFQDKVTLSGARGYIFLIAVVIPINLLLKSYIAETLHLTYDQAQFAEIGGLILLNIVLFLAMDKFMPALETSGFVALLVFTLLFSAASYLVHRIPEIDSLTTQVR